MYVYVYMCVCVCLFAFLMNKSLQPTLSGLPSFTPSLSSLYFRAYLVIQRRQLRCGSTQELP